MFFNRIFINLISISPEIFCCISLFILLIVFFFKLNKHYNQYLLILLFSSLLFIFIILLLYTDFIKKDIITFFNLSYNIILIKFFYFILTFILLYSIQKNINLLNINCFYFFFICNLLIGFFILNSIDLLLTFILLEIQSYIYIIFFILTEKKKLDIEITLKYFIISTITSILMCCGIIYIYLSFLTFNLNNINIICLIYSNKNIYLFQAKQILGLIGFSLIVLSLIIKIGMFPFHKWLVDLYLYGNTKIVIIFSILPKIIYFFFLSQLILTIKPLILLYPSSNTFILIISILSIFFGSLNAILAKNNFKLFLVYSSISHFGFIFLNYYYISIYTVINTFLYLFFYSFTSLILWIYLLKIEENFKINRFIYFNDFSNFFTYNKLFSIPLILSIFLLAGWPPFINFFFKYIIFINLNLNCSNFFIFFIFYLSNCFTFFYYLRFIIICLNTQYKKIFFINSLNKKNIYFFFLFIFFLITTFFYYPYLYFIFL